jgi:GNAT superfamily N-acetyltransferase
MMAQIRVRVFRSADAGAVGKLWQEAGLLAANADGTEEATQAAQREHSAMFVATVENEIVGTCAAGHARSVGWFDSLGVAADARGTGCGRKLIEHAEGWLRSHGISEIALRLPDDSNNGRDFLVHLGYGIEPGLIMTKHLGAEPADDDRIKVVITYLEMTQPPTRPGLPIPPGKIALLRAENPSIGFYRFLYNTIGEPWFWIDRRRLDDAVLEEIITDPRVEIYVLYVGGAPAGYVELDRRPAPDINVAYFGLMPQFIGRGFGPYLLHWALDAAWQYQPRRLTTDTCTLDHPKAYALYQRAGFAPYRQETKLIDDPRHAGLIPAHRQPRRP